MDTCAVCTNTVGVQRCAKCGNAKYCSPHCQKQVWIFHKHHCKKIDSPIIIRQPKLVAQEFDWLMACYGNKAEYASFPKHLLAEKYVQFSAAVEKMEEVERHEELIKSRVRILELLSKEGPTYGPIVDDKGMTKLDLLALKPFYTMAKFETDIEPQNLQQRAIHERIYKAFFNIFVLTSRNISGGDVLVMNFPMVKPSYLRLKKEVSDFEIGRFEGYKEFRTYFREMEHSLLNVIEKYDHFLKVSEKRM